MNVESGTFLMPNIRLSHKLGEGGMGEVWVADHLTLERRVAVKLISGVDHNETARLRFEREAKAAASIQNPHVVQVFDYGTTPSGSPFITMELLSGEDLAQRIGRGALTPAELAPILIQTASALASAHQNGIVHRDIKPPNIFLVSTPTGEPFVKVLDFGIALLQSATPQLGGGNTSDAVAATAAAPAASQPSLTGTGALLGTPNYMSPEQLLTTDEITHTTDIWSLGVVAYEALVGTRAFDGETIVALCMSICEARYDRARVPEQLRGWFDRVLAIAPQERYASVIEAAEAFRAIALDSSGVGISGVGISGLGNSGLGNSGLGVSGLGVSGVGVSSVSGAGVAASIPGQAKPRGLTSGLTIALGLVACVAGAAIVTTLYGASKSDALSDASPNKASATKKKSKKKSSPKSKKRKKQKKRAAEPTETSADAPEPRPAEPTPTDSPLTPETAAPVVVPTGPAVPRPPTAPAVPSQCKESCSSVGACKASGSRCVVASSSDCRGAYVCKQWGKCTLVGSSCNATATADCAACNRCKTHGACGLSGSTCGPIQDAHCRQSSGCSTSGLCVARSGICIPGSSADCQASARCKSRNECKKRGMICRNE